MKFFILGVAVALALAALGWATYSIGSERARMCDDKPGSVPAYTHRVGNA